MACSACRGTGSRKIVYQVRFPSGRVRRYSSEAEARTAARAGGGTYTEVRE